MTEKEKISKATDDAVASIANAAGKAREVIANAAAEARKLVNETTSETQKKDKAMIDHDLLVVLNTKMEDLKDDIQDLKDGTSQRITSLEICKVDKDNLIPIKEKLDLLEGRIWYLVAGILLALAVSAINFVIKK